MNHLTRTYAEIIDSCYPTESSEKVSFDLSPLGKVASSRYRLAGKRHVPYKITPEVMKGLVSGLEIINCTDGDPVMMNTRKMFTARDGKILVEDQVEILNLLSGDDITPMGLYAFILGKYFSDTKFKGIVEENLLNSWTNYSVSGLDLWVAEESDIDFISDAVEQFGNRNFATVSLYLPNVFLWR